MTKTLYEQYKDGCDDLHRRGYVSIVQMMRQFNRICEMGRALGRFEKVIGRWARGTANPSWQAESIAAAWISANGSHRTKQERQASIPQQKEVHAVNDVNSPKPSPDGLALMVICKSSAAAKVMRVLGVLGCEVVEI